MVEREQILRLMVIYLKSVGKPVPPELKEIERKIEEEKKQWRGVTTPLKGR